MSLHSHQPKTKSISEFNPYHYCADGWNVCCQKNLSLQESSQSLKTFFNTREKYLKYSKFALTYSKWVWFNETFFEHLPLPKDIKENACGLCITCTLTKGKEHCLFPQPDNTYQEWYNQKVQDWL